MTDLSLGADASGYWPSTGSLLLLKLLVHIFPSTDFRCAQQQVSFPPHASLRRQCKKSSGKVKDMLVLSRSTNARDTCNFSNRLAVPSLEIFG